MWLNGYGASVHRVYFGPSREGVTRATPDSPEYRGSVENEANVFHLKISLNPDKKYFWRVDAESSPSGMFYRGDVWSFSTGVGGEILSSRANTRKPWLSLTFQVTMILVILLYITLDFTDRSMKYC